MSQKKMKCPACGHTESKVIDSRPTDEFTSIRRRRECMACQKRFTTYEIIDAIPMTVVKKDGTKELFDRNKIFVGLMKACDKRSVSREQMEALVSEIENELQNSLKTEHKSKEIGDLLMKKLKELDEVAYVRFASVHRQFKDLESFMSELQELKNEKVQRDAQTH